ncbi:hypothetical protein Hanom_Chr10g00894571 [Helianthus anomalus]
MILLKEWMEMYGNKWGGLYNSIFTDAMMQVWGCLATSKMLYQRIHGRCLFLLYHNSFTATDTHFLSDQVHVFLYPIFYVFSCIWWCETLFRLGNVFWLVTLRVSRLLVCLVGIPGLVLKAPYIGDNVSQVWGCGNPGRDLWIKARRD